MIDSTASLVEPRPLRLKVGRSQPRSRGSWVINARRVTGIAVLRIAFGAIWAVDASLKWQPAFQANFQQILSGVAKGQPGFLAWWFALWQFVVSGRAPIFALMTAGTETYLALALLTGFARKFTYSLGILYGLFVWSVAEGFGGPYMPGTTTDVGAAIIYPVARLNSLGVGMVIIYGNPRFALFAALAPIIALVNWLASKRSTRKERRRHSRAFAAALEGFADDLRGRAADERALGVLTEPHRRELHVHCDRLLGSFQNAADAVHATLVAAWRRLDTFEQRASFRSSPYSLAPHYAMTYGQV